MSFKKLFKNQAGFTLIEIAIVLAIIGIIIAGSVKGLNLLESARLKAIHAQINEFRIAAYTYYDQYGVMPGHNSKNLTVSNYDEKNSNEKNLKGTADNKFWIDLKTANMINFNGDFPSSQLGGSYSIINDDPDFPGTWIRLGQNSNNQSDGGLLTPEQAKKIMMANDNDNPKDGSIRAKDGLNIKNNKKCLTGNALDLSHKEAACVLYFQL